jgi:hypothetical protein
MFFHLPNLHESNHSIRFSYWFTSVSSKDSVKLYRWKTWRTVT